MWRVLLRESATSYARVFAFLWVATRTARERRPLPAEPTGDRGGNASGFSFTERVKLHSTVSLCASRTLTMRFK